MTDRLTQQQRSFNMARIRGRDTRPEMTVRRLLHAQGFRFRLHRRDLPGRPDIVLTRWKTAIFVHGCFWHGHHCPLFRWPASNPDFWRTKIEGNMSRDAAALLSLHSTGWRSLVVWECALKGRGRLTPEALAEALASFITASAQSGEIGGFGGNG